MAQARKRARKPPLSEECNQLADDYAMAHFIVKRPAMMLGEVRSLSEVLALLQGVAVGRYPPLGHGFLPGFGQLVNNRHGVPNVVHHHGTLLKAYRKMPWMEACKAILELLEEWQAQAIARPNTSQSPPGSA
jgi:hypothetical protein